MLKKEDHIITDEVKIFTATNMPLNLIGKWKVKPLTPVACGIFKGDKMPIEDWSINDKFTKGVEYPMYYDSENNCDFAIGSDGKAYTVHKTDWTKLTDF